MRNRLLLPMLLVAAGCGGALTADRPPLRPDAEPGTPPGAEASLPEANASLTAHPAPPDVFLDEFVHRLDVPDRGALLRELEAAGGVEMVVAEIAAGRTHAPAVVLARVDPEGASWLGPLGKLLASPDPRVRSRAADALGTASIWTDAGTSLLLAALEDRDEMVRENAADGLRYLEERAAEVVPALVRALDDESPRVLGEAVSSLGSLMYDVDFIPVAPFVRMLTHAEADVRYVAALWMDRAGGDPSVPGALAAALSDPDRRVRDAAAESLGQIGSRCRAVAPALERALRDEDSSVRFEAALALFRVTGESGKAVATLLADCREDPHEHGYFEAFGEIGPGAADAVPLLLSEIEKESPDAYAITALGKIGPAAAVAVPRLLELVRTRENGVYRAAKALERIGPAAREAVPALLEMLVDEETHEEAVTALAGQGAGVIPDLLRLLRGKETAAAALRALQEVGPAAAPAVPEILEFLGSKEPELREGALDAVGAIGNVDARVVPLLIGRLDDPDSDVRNAAVCALWDAGAGDPLVLPAVAARLTDEDEVVRYNVARILEEAEGAARPVLERLADGPDEALRTAAKKALEWLDSP